ncbi:hypothetical protein O6H91_Y536800 [Diphasiastrum complanatum]|nr:hypothetical protein O6H91_Y536800 [Diphasiastrum complanatum]
MAMASGITSIAQPNAHLQSKFRLSSQNGLTRWNWVQHCGLRAATAATPDVSLLSTTVSSGNISFTHRLVKVRAMASPAVSAPKREKDPKKRVVITGMGLVSVFGSDVDKYYEKLLEGQSGISYIDRFDVSKFSTKFAGQIRDFSSEGYIDGKNDRRLDDCIRYCIVSGKKAMEHAGLGSEVGYKVDKQRLGALVGSGMGGLTVFQDGVLALIDKGPKRMTPFFIPYIITNMPTALLGIEIGSMGPNYSISTACATSNYCLYAAANHIRRGDADVIVAGGTEAALIPVGLGGFIACRALSHRNDDPQTASRPWDKDRDGFVLSEGAGVLVRWSGLDLHIQTCLYIYIEISRSWQRFLK